MMNSTFESLTDEEYALGKMLEAPSRKSEIEWALARMKFINACTKKGHVLKEDSTGYPRCERCHLLMSN